MSNAAAINRPGQCDLYVTRGFPGSVQFTFPSGTDLSGVDTCKVTDNANTPTEIDLSSSIVIASNVVTISYTAANATAMADGSTWSWYLADADATPYITGRVYPADLIGSGVGTGATSAVEVGTLTGTVEVTVVSVGPPGADGVDGDGDVNGPASATDSAIALFDGAGGKTLKDSAVTISTDDTLASDSDAKVPTEQAVKAYVDANVGGGDAAVSAQPIGTIVVIPMVLPESGDSVGSHSLLASGSYLYSCINFTNALNDIFAWDVYLEAGTWEMTLVYTKTSGGGILTPTIAGDTGTAIDTYQSSTNFNQIATENFTVATTALQSVQIETTGKNASSSGYDARIHYLALRRVANP